MLKHWILKTIYYYGEYNEQRQFGTRFAVREVCTHINLTWPTKNIIVTPTLGSVGVECTFFYKKKKEEEGFSERFWINVRCGIAMVTKPWHATGNHGRAIIFSFIKTQNRFQPLIRYKSVRQTVHLFAYYRVLNFLHTFALRRHKYFNCFIIIIM